VPIPGGLDYVRFRPGLSIWCAFGRTTDDAEATATSPWLEDVRASHRVLVAESGKA